MPLVFRVNGTDLGNQAVRLGQLKDGFVSRAEKGALGTGGLPVDDDTGALAIAGLLPFTVDETSSAGGSRLWTGYLQDRTIRRGAGSGSPSLITGAARLWDCNIVDLNAIFQFRVFTAADANRPAETINARIAWVKASPQMALVTGGWTYIDSSTQILSANDYRGNYPLDVINDIVNTTGWDYYLFHDAGTGLVTLFLGDSTAATRVCTLAISNVLSDVSSTVLAPLIDGFLLRDPSRVYSGILLNYVGGSTYQTDPTTAATFGVARDVVVSSSRIGRAATAVTQAQQYLASSSSEADRISCTIKLPASQVNLVDAGMRINAKFTHLPGYETGKNMRIALRQVKADEETDEFYNCYLELITPIVTNYRWFGGGSVPDIPPAFPTPSNQPACLVSLGTASFSHSDDGTYPTQPAIPISGTVGSRLYGADPGPGNPCYTGFGSTGTLYWGSTIASQEFIATATLTPPVGAVLARLSASVTTDDGPYGTAGAHGWQLQFVVGHAPHGFYDGQTVLASTTPDVTISGDVPANAIAAGSVAYCIEVPSWSEPERRVCGVSTTPFPGGDYWAGPIALEWLGFCDGTVGVSNWVGGIGAVDGVNRTFILGQWDWTGNPQAKVNGLLTPVTNNGNGTVTFQNAPPAGSYVTFNYNVGPAPVTGPAPIPPTYPPANPGSLQALIDAAATGTTILVTPGTYTSQTVDVNKANLTFDGQGSLLNASGQPYGISVTAPGCTVKNWTVENAGNAQQTGAIRTYASSTTFDTVRATANAGAGIAIAASNCTVTNSEFDHNAQEGYAIYDLTGSTVVSNVTFSNCHIHDNNPNQQYAPGWEAGGGKAARTSTVTFDGCEVDHNVGPGIWYDIDNTDIEVKNCKVHHNWVGIMVEISSGALIHGNAVWENGWTNNTQNWGWPAAILISSSSACEVYSNTLGWNDIGISVLSQNRGSGLYDWNVIHDDYVHDNVVVATDVYGGSSDGLRMQCWFQDFAGTLFSDSTNRDGGNNQFYSTLAQPSSGRFWYNGAYTTVAAFAATTGGTGSTNIASLAAAQALLTAAGIPTTPEHT